MYGYKKKTLKQDATKRSDQSNISRNNLSNEKEKKCSINSISKTDKCETELCVNKLLILLHF